MMDKKQRVLIVDDHTLLRAGLRSLLAQDPNIEIVGEAADGRDAVRAVGQLTPDLVLMDLTMPGMNGIEAVTEIKRRYPEVRILVMTLHKTEDFIHASLRAGADGYILKDATHDELRVAIRSVLQGKPYLDTNGPEKAANAYPAGNSSSAASALDALTPRERDVLRLVAAGKSSKCIAELLSLSVKTVGKHRANLMAKLDVHNAAGLTAYAIERGLLS